MYWKIFGLLTLSEWVSK